MSYFLHHPKHILPEVTLLMKLQISLIPKLFNCLSFYYKYKRTPPDYQEVGSILYRQYLHQEIFLLNNRVITHWLVPQTFRLISTLFYNPHSRNF